MITAATLAAAVKAAKPGDVLACEGLFPRLTLGRVPEGITLTGGTWAGLRADALRGVTLRDMVFRDGTVGLKSVGSVGVRLEGCTFLDLDRGASFGSGADLEVVSCTAQRMRIDAFDFGECRRWAVRRCAVLGAVTQPGGAHPDAIQGWSRPTSAPAADIVIEDNLIEGDCQGIGLFNHVRDGVDDGGFDRVTIRRNRVIVARPMAVAVLDARGLVLADNWISTLPGAERQARIRVEDCGSVQRFGNRMDAFVEASGARRAGIVEGPL